MRATLVHPYEQLGSDPCGLFTPSRSLLLIALLGYGGLFLSDHRPGSRWIARLIVAVETLMPRSSSNASQCSWRVRSGLSFSCSGSHAASITPLRAGGPGTPFLGSRLPVSFRSLSQRFMVGKDTEKVFATSFLGTPWSTVASTRSLRSLEYGFMSGVSSRINNHASRCEALCKMLCHNICLLVQAVHELNRFLCRIPACTKISYSEELCTKSRELNRRPLWGKKRERRCMDAGRTP